MRATINEAASSPGQEAVTLVAHAAKARLIHDQDATITAKMMQNLGPILTAFNQRKTPCWLRWRRTENNEPVRVLPGTK